MISLILIMSAQAPEVFMKRVKSVICIILYVLAALMMAYAVWSFVYCNNLISEMVNAGQLEFAGNEYDIINFYMSGSAQYVVFALLLAAAGWMISKTNSKASAVQIPEITALAEEDEDLDEWMKELQSKQEQK